MIIIIFYLISHLKVLMDWWITDQILVIISPSSGSPFGITETWKSKRSNKGVLAPQFDSLIIQGI